VSRKVFGLAGGMVALVVAVVLVMQLSSDEKQAPVAQTPAPVQAAPESPAVVEARARARETPDDVRIVAIWRNGKFHEVKMTGGRLANGLLVTGSPNEIEEQLPPVDPNLANLTPSAEETAKAEERAAQRTVELRKQLGVPPPDTPTPTQVPLPIPPEWVAPG
jgi:hypothetical protein